MRLILKILILFVGVVLLGVAALTALFYLRGNELLAYYKPALEYELSKAINGSVSLGHLQATILPQFTFQARNVTVRGPAHLEAWKIDELDLAADLPALLHGRLEFHSINISGLDAALRKEPPGIQSSSKPPVQQTPAPAAEQTPPPKTRIIIALKFNEFTIRNSSLTITEGKQRRQITLQDARGGLSLGADMLLIPSADIRASIGDVPLLMRTRGVAIQNGTAQVNELVLGVGPDTLNITGSFAFDRQVNAVVSTKSVDLGRIAAVAAKILDTKAWPIAGMLQGSVQLSGTPEALTATAKLSARTLRLSDSQIESLDLSNLALTIINREVSTAKLEASVAGLEIRDGFQVYTTESGTLSATAKAKGGWTLNGTMQAKNFGYRDDATNIRNVNATVSDIKAAINDSGVVVDMQVDGRSILLNAPSVEITEVKRVTSPLRVSVPSAGGYAVSGPVTAEGGVVTLEGRKLTDVSGTVAILVSGPLKEFKAKRLVAGSFGQRLEAAADFVMTKESYKAQIASLILADGAISGSWYMGRKNDVGTGIDLDASGINLKRAIMAITQAESETDGTLQQLTVSARAERGKLQQTASGSGKIVVVGEPPNGFRIRRRVIQALSAVPAAGDLLQTKDSVEEAPDRSIRAELRIADGKLYAEHIKAERPNYNIEGDVSVAFDKTLSGSLRIIFLKRTMRALGMGIEPLKKLFSRAGRVTFPLILSGTTDDPQVTPDYVQIAKNASGLGIAQSVAKALLSGGKAIAGVFSQGDSSGAAQETPAPQSR